jgi:multisubunit Na+/H+ antiporter MnhB subunit
MDQPTLIGTGFVVLGGVLWILCAYYCYQVAPRFQRRAAVWGILGILFGPLALMALYVLPKGHVVSDKGRGAQPGTPGHKKDKQAELYEVPKKHH